MAFDRARTERLMEKLDRTIKHNQAKIEEVTRKQEARDRRLAIVDAEVEKARKELRKLGLLDPE
jgi:uncharacterized protein HemX